MLISVFATVLMTQTFYLLQYKIHGRIWFIGSTLWLNLSSTFDGFDRVTKSIEKMSKEAPTIVLSDIQSLSANDADENTATAIVRDLSLADQGLRSKNFECFSRALDRGGQWYNQTCSASHSNEAFAVEGQNKNLEVGEDASEVRKSVEVPEVIMSLG